MKKMALLFLAVALTVGSGCAWTHKASSFNGMTDMDGNSVTHMRTTNLGVTLLFEKPLVGDASLDGTVNTLTSQAKAAGNQHVRIVHSRETYMWFIFPPFSFVVQPVLTTVAADVTPGK